MTIRREVAQAALDALDIGADCARECADVVHETLRGYKPQRHAQVDADVKAIEDARDALRAALAAEPAQPVAVGSWEFMKLAMQVSAWGGVLQLDDALKNIDDFAKEAASQPPADVPMLTDQEMLDLIVMVCDAADLEESLHVGRMVEAEVRRRMGWWDE